MRGVVIGRVFEKLPETLDDLIKDVLPQGLINVLRVGILYVSQDHLLIEPQQVSSGKQQEIQRKAAWKLPQLCLVFNKICFVEQGTYASTDLPPISLCRLLT